MSTGDSEKTPVGGTQIFLRDDDVSVLSEAFISFFRRFADARLPVSYQVIPEPFSEECAAFLREESSRVGFDLGQHGLRHQMMVNGRLEFYEFGPERTFDEQLHDIQTGKAILQRMLGPKFHFDVFTPPRHRYDRNTLLALKQSGFQLLSASSYVGLKYRLAYSGGRAFRLTNLGRSGVPHHGLIRPDSGLLEYSIAVSLDDGGKINTTVSEAMDRVAVARKFTRQVGLLFHHEAFGSAEGMAFLDDLIRRLKAMSGVSFHTLGDLLRENLARRGVVTSTPAV